MNKTRNYLTPILGVSLFLWITGGLLQAQEGEDVYELNPFTVEDDQTIGYYAASTLAGTRIRSDLKDIGATISVYTKQFLEDVDATDFEELLVYTTGTEVAGLGGTMSVRSFTGRFSFDFSSERFSATRATRVRGLAGADNTRGYYNTILPFDSYNIERVTINRGANNILFGLGSPAGIIDRAPVRPFTGELNELELRTDNYGSLRTTFDMNRSFAEGKVNMRLVGLYDWREFRQDPAFDKNRRLYGAIDFNIQENTRFRAHFEIGDRDGTPQVLVPPIDRFTLWWTEPQLNQELNDPFVGPNNGRDFTGNPPFSPILFHDSTTNPKPSNFGIVGLHKNFFVDWSRPAWYGVDDPNKWRRNDETHPEHEIALYSRSSQILDPAIFDFNNIQLAGRNDRVTHDFEAYNLAFQHEMFDGQAGIEIGHDHQEMDTGAHDFIGSHWRSIYLGIDINESFPDGSTNPNAGRPYVNFSPVWREGKSTIETSRITAFFKLDAAEKFDGLGKWLGRHNFTGMYEDTSLDRSGINGTFAKFGQEYADAYGLNAGQAGNSGGNFLRPNFAFHVGPSLVGASSPTDADIQGIRGPIQFPTQASVLYQLTGDLSDPSVPREFETGTFPLFTYPNDKDDLTMGGFLLRDDTKSRVLSIQSFWLMDHLVSTLGWRTDEFTKYENRNPGRDSLGAALVSPSEFSLPTTPGIDTEIDSFSWSVVGHAPEFIDDMLPEGADVSLHYAESENFAPASLARNPFGGFFGPPTGTTEDYGVTISLLDNKFVARMTWYETLQDNIADADIDEPYFWYFANIPRIVYENNSLEAIEASGFPNALPAQALQDNYQWQFTNNPDGSRTLEVVNNGATDIVQALSEGFELDLTANITPNWRLTLNAAQQKAVRTGVGRTGGEELKRLEALWLDPAIADGLISDVGQELRWRIEQQAQIFDRLTLDDGRRVDELREWRYNLITNYTFDPDSKLKGWEVGGAMRYQDPVSIGNEIVNDPELGLIPDVDQPVWGPSETKFDLWFSYNTKFFSDVDWILRFHVRNLFNEDDLIPIYYNPDSTPDLVRLAQERSWTLSSTFRF